MRKIFLLLLIVSLMILSGCDLLQEMTCNHQLEVIERVESTCSVQGIVISKCANCTYQKKVNLPLSNHDFLEGHYQPTCEQDGYTLQTCSICSYSQRINIVNKYGHDYSEWELLQNATDINDGLKQRKCNRCDYIEQEIILSISYVDRDIIRFEYEENKTYDINNYQELLLTFNAALLNNSKKLICNIKYELGDFNTLLNRLVNECEISLSYHVSASLQNKVLTITITYDNIATKSTQNYVYEQYISSNYVVYQSNRLDNYDEFKINNSIYSYDVQTTEQLVYVLERNCKPICKENSKAFQVYNEIKKVLKEIIDDNMSDIEKVKAIYEWLILNVTYDDELLQLVSSSQNIKEYNGFYLEGVFIDKKAVCEGISKAFACMANIEGIPCVIVEGYNVNNPNGLGHAWNKVYINNNWYIVDATSGGTIINDEFEILSYKYFLIDEATMNLKYRGNNYKNLVCNNNYDYYSNTLFIINNKEYDFVIDSQSELTNLIEYYSTNKNTHKTIEFKVTFDFGDSIGDEIKKAYSELNIIGKFSYITNNDIIVLVN